MQYHLVYDADGMIRSQIGDTGDGQAEAHDARVLARYPGGGVLVTDAPADPATQMVVDGQLAARLEETRLLSAAQFQARFTDAEKAQLMTTPALIPLALSVLTAPNGVDVTDATAAQARTALENAGWSSGRLDAIFAPPSS